MTALQLYAVSETSVDALPHGAAGEELVQIAESGLTAVAGRADAPASALEFARVVGRLADTASSVLPARLGEAFADENALRAALSANAAGLHRTLEQVRGCVEIGLRASFPDAPVASPDISGRDYLRSRAADLHLIDELVAHVHEPLARLARDARLEHGHAPPRFAAAYLVPRSGLDALRTRAEQLSRTCAEPKLVVGGPWPPYSFTGLKGAP